MFEEDNYVQRLQCNVCSRNANGGPEKFAGTPKVNTFMVNKVYHDNLKAGMPKAEANVRKIEAQKLVKATKDWRGY